LERTYHEKLKEFIIKYSRPLRRFLNSEEILDLFHNIEKVNFELDARDLMRMCFLFQICAISQSIARQCEKFLEEDTTSDVSISSIYQSSVGVIHLSIIDCTFLDFSSV